MTGDHTGSMPAEAGPSNSPRTGHGEEWRAKMMRPYASEYPSSCAGYIDLVPEDDVLPVLRGQIESARQFAASVPQDRETYAYAPGKWTIRQVAGHLGDGERAFSFRAFCFSRADQNPLPGFEEDAYVEQSNFNGRRLADLVEEFALLRSANLRMLSALRDDQWARSGVANGSSITVRALAFGMAGHVRHHFKTLRDRYAVKVRA